jgi:hypothetical protein
LRNYCRRDEDAAHVPTTTLGSAHTKITRRSRSVTVSLVTVTLGDISAADGAPLDRNWNVF